MVRQPAVAGTFYPANAGILRQTVEQLLKASVTSFETGLLSSADAASLRNAERCADDGV
jgi:predicted class III extradiol MEMO1 family dioxygenase